MEVHVARCCNQESGKLPRERLAGWRRLPWQPTHWHEIRTLPLRCLPNPEDIEHLALIKFEHRSATDGFTFLARQARGRVRAERPVADATAVVAPRHVVPANRDATHACCLFFTCVPCCFFRVITARIALLSRILRVEAMLHSVPHDSSQVPRQHPFLEDRRPRRARGRNIKTMYSAVVSTAVNQLSAAV
jgi:hypothetical protein